MSHITGTVQIQNPPLAIGPGATVFNPPAAPGGTKLLMLHFQNANLLPGDQLQVKLGYDTDVFTAADGPSFWTRPVNVYAFPAGVEISYVAAGPATGSVQLDMFGRGERHIGEATQPMPSFSNCDPFYQPPPTLSRSTIRSGSARRRQTGKIPLVSALQRIVRARVARSAGMVITAEVSLESGIFQLSTCSVTLVDADKVLTAGHCHTPEEVISSSVTFDFIAQCDGSRPPGYNPRFYKVKGAALKQQNLGTQLDYSLLQLAEAPVGIPVIQMRPSLPAVGEQVFGIHHPNGAVKKLSIPSGQGFATVTGSSAAGGITVPRTFHVSGGSSGSGLYDMAGRIVGVLSRGAPCQGGALAYCPTPNILADIAPAAPPPPITRDVMLVFDRSGSMSMDDGTGRQKIEAARDAVSLFVQLVRAGTGNRAGLVSFSTATGVDSALADVTAGLKNTLIGPAPFVGGKVGALMPDQMTSIGAGLDAAHGQFPAAGANPRAILLMTDGLQNTAPMIADVQGELGGINVHAIGFGTESSLDGALLSSLTTSLGGLYTRAGNGLALEKFFSSAFGNIFESGVLMDPEFDLPAHQSGNPIALNVCGEETLTAVAGWDRTDTELFLEVTSPGGAVIGITTAGIETSSGRTWTFLRVPLPFGGERNGTWSVRVIRPGGGGEFPPPTPALRYFINVIADGGPKLIRAADSRRYYTGDRIAPIMFVRYENGSWPDAMEVSVTVSCPDTGVGNVLSKAGLGSSTIVGGDGIPVRQATLRSIEQGNGKPIVNYVDKVFTLSDDALNNGGVFESGGQLGLNLDELLVVEGHYTFHARASYGVDCPGARELVWSILIDVGIDSGHTTVTTTPGGTGPGGGETVHFTFTPADRYGNLVGPGRGDSFTLVPQPGSTPTGPVVDLGNGSYQVDVTSDPGSIVPPRVGIVQPGRAPVVVGPRDFRLFVYSVKFLCGEQKEDCCGCAPVRPGRYSTEINIHNTSAKEAPLVQGIIPLVLAGTVSGRAPKVKTITAPEVIRLPAHSATMEDCCRILARVLGARAGCPDAPLHRHSGAHQYCGVECYCRVYGNGRGRPRPINRHSAGRGADTHLVEAFECAVPGMLWPTGK